MKIKIDKPVIVMLVACLLSSFSSGCGKKTPAGPQLGQVKGVVTMADQPLANAAVAFHPVNSGDSSYAQTNENGEFSLAYSNGDPGAIPGEHRVEITTRREVVDASGKVLVDEPERVPQKYNVKSQLTAQVHENDQVIDFKLNSK